MSQTKPQAVPRTAPEIAAAVVDELNLSYDLEATEDPRGDDLDSALDARVREAVPEADEVGRDELKQAARELVQLGPAFELSGEAVDACGCQLARVPSGLTMRECPLHANARALLAVVKELQVRVFMSDGASQLYARAGAVITAVQGPGLVAEALPPGPTRAEVMADPSASTWLKAALRATASMDPVDAANDAEVLAAVLAQAAR